MNDFDNYERHTAIREGHFNQASDEYFEARPQIDSAANRRVFYAGHCKGYDTATESLIKQIESDAEELAALRAKVAEFEAQNARSREDW